LMHAKILEALPSATNSSAGTIEPAISHAT
jgi:hypothetical protein